MKDRRIAVAAMAALWALTAGAALAAGGEPKLANAKRVFVGAQPDYKTPTQRHAFTMRLSPDCKRLLYTRRTAETAQADRRSAQYEIVLHELATGKQAVLPTGPVGRGIKGVFSRFNFFDPAGKRQAIATIKRETTRIDKHASATRTKITWSVYDVAALTDRKGKPKPLVSGIEGSQGLAKFTADGKGLITSVANIKKRSVESRIISLADPDAKPTVLSAKGWVQSVCPAGRLAVFYEPPSPPMTRSMSRPRPRPPIRLALWDLQANKESALLPTHPRNSVLDDWETQWTSDGRYLYYYDCEEIATEAGQGQASLRIATRVWDAKSAKQAGMIRDAIPVGPGPGGATMVLAKRAVGDSGGILLHSAADGKEYVLGSSDKKLIHAFAGKVIYAETPAGSDEEVVFLADIVAPKSDS